MRQLLLIGVALWLSAASAGAATPPDERSRERARIAAERREVGRRYEAARRACEQRFTVSACLEEARGERRQALDRLAGEQAVLDDAQRRQRAADRLRALQQKAREADDRSLAPPPAPKLTQRSASAPAPRASAAAPHASRPATTPEQAERQRREQALREQEAQAHREAVRKRNAEREARKPPAAPLPVPSAPGKGASR